MDYNDIISNVKIYDLEESLIASGYPMRTKKIIHDLNTQDFERGERLVKATLKGNTAHHQFLTGVRVNFDLTLTNKAWVEAERYRFLEFVSSQSTMHRITKFDLNGQYIEYVDPRIIEIMKEKIKDYNALCNALVPQSCDMVEAHEKLKKEKYLEILYSNPSGFELTARLTTNYRQLKTIYAQRKTHRLPEWRDFCTWVETLPMFKELCLGGDSDAK